MEYVQAGDAVGLEQFLSDTSPSERELAYAAEAGADGGRTPILVALKSGSLELVQSILKWLPEGQVREQVFVGRFYMYTETWEVRSRDQIDFRGLLWTSRL